MHFVDSMNRNAVAWGMSKGEVITGGDALLDRLECLAALKDVKRTGWVLRGVREPESVADHSWGTAQLCLLLAPPDIDGIRAVMIALVHDLAEVETGDIPRRVHPGAGWIPEKEKRRREEAAIRNLTDVSSSPESLPGEQLRLVRELWEEYAEGTTEEAKFVRDMNLADMCLQAVIYERERRYDPHEGSEHFPHYPALDEFFATSGERFVTEIGRELYRALQSRYLRLRRASGHAVPDK